jgi:hypothetical protein
MRRKIEKLRRISTKTERARTATRDERDAVEEPLMGSDLELVRARALLDGYVEVDRRGRLRSKYYRRGSREESDARRAMARLLRSKDPLERQLRDSLAGLFDPDHAPAWKCEHRKIKIVGQGRGNRRNHVRDTQIAEHVWEKVRAGAKVIAATESAAEVFGRDLETIKKIWGKYKPLLEAVYGSARAPRGGS